MRAYFRYSRRNLPVEVVAGVHQVVDTMQTFQTERHALPELDDLISFRVGGFPKKLGEIPSIGILEYYIASTTLSEGAVVCDDVLGFRILERS